MLYFDPTPINFTLMLVLALGAWAIHSASKQRPDANLPLIFYAIILIFNRLFDLQLDITLILGGIALAALIRFEFLSKTFIRWITYLEIAVLVMILWNGLGVIFGPGLSLRI